MFKHRKLFSKKKRDFSFILNSIVNGLIKEWDKYRPASQEYLSSWFEFVYKIFEKAERHGRILYKTWYQTAYGSRLVEIPIGKPIYKVRILLLPQVLYKKKTYHTQISQTHLVPGIFHPTHPEIKSQQLDLIINGTDNDNKIPTISFTCSGDMKHQELFKYQIRFAEGRELTAAEVKFVKSIYDAAILKSKKTSKANIV